MKSEMKFSQVTESCMFQMKSGAPQVIITWVVSMLATWSNMKVLGSGLECSRRVVEESTDKHKFCSPSADPEPSVGGRIRTKTLIASPSLLKTKDVAAEFTGEKEYEPPTASSVPKSSSPTSPKSTHWHWPLFKRHTWPKPFTDLSFPLISSQLPFSRLYCLKLTEREFQTRLISGFPLKSNNKVSHSKGELCYEFHLLTLKVRRQG